MSVIDQKRIAKNTALLYVRMLLIMAISLYTSRVILSTLGKIDFGLYNVIGAIVVNFSFLNGMLSSACSRYFAIELGRNDHKALKRVFSLNLTLFIVLGVIILLLSESVGLWFLNNKMKIPSDRMVAAQWVYQCSIVAFIINMLSTPYRSIIIAREKMKIFAYSSIIETVLKLGIVFLLLISPVDKLITYAVLMLLITVGTSGFYYLYCKHYYAECRYSFVWDKSLLKEILGYTGWNVIGILSGIGKSAGVNLLLNMFYGAIVNTARGIAYQVFVNVNQFVTNFTTAFNPQITKSYSANARCEMLKLVFQSSKFSYYLLFLLVLPVIAETPYLLDLWLGKDNVVEYSVSFARLMLIAALIDSISYPLVTSVQATGKVKWYQIMVGGTMLMVLPISYFMLKFGNFEPEIVFYIIIAASVVAQVFRVYFMKRQLGMDVALYCRCVLLPIGVTTVIPSIIVAGVSLKMASSFVNLVVVTLISIVVTCITIAIFGLTDSERKSIVRTIKDKIGK